MNDAQHNLKEMLNMFIFDVLIIAYLFMLFDLHKNKEFFLIRLPKTK